MTSPVAHLAVQIDIRWFFCAGLIFSRCDVSDRSHLAVQIDIHRCFCAGATAALIVTAASLVIHTMQSKSGTKTGLIISVVFSSAGNLIV